MSFFMSNRGIYTIDAIRQGIRIATSRYYPNEIELIKKLKVGQLIRFIRTDKYKQIVDSIIVSVSSIDVFNTSSSSKVWLKLDNHMFDDKNKLKELGIL